MPETNLAGSMSVSSRKAIFGSIAVSVAFVMELTLVPLFLPAIQKQFELSIGLLAWVFNAYGVAVAFGVLLGGWFGDAFDAKKVFGVGVLFFASGSILVAFADSYEVMIVGRVVQGFGGGVFSPLVPLLLTRATPHRPGKVLIVWGSVTGFVAASAPLFYSSVLASYGWNFAFVVFAIVSTAAMVIVLGSHIEDEPASRQKPRPSYSKLFRSRDLWVIFGYVFCTYGSITYYLFRLPLWLSDNQFQVVSIGFTLSIMWLSFSVVSTLLRNRVDAPQVRRILMAAPVFIASGFALAYFCHTITCLTLSSVLVGIGLACSNAPSTQMTLMFAPKRMRAFAASLDITFARLGGVATVALLAQSMFGYAVLVVVLLCFVALLCALATARTLNNNG